MNTQDKTVFGKLPTFFKTVVEFVEHEDVQASLKKIPGIIEGFRKQANQTNVVTYNEIVEYFVIKRPDNDQIQKGALLIEEHPSGKKLTLLFLDSNNEPVLYNGNSPYGKTIIAKEIDEALSDFSEGRSLIIFE